jgi:hypothetical protein
MLLSEPENAANQGSIGREIFGRLNDWSFLPNINLVESAAVAEDCPLNFIPSAEGFLWVNQLCLLKVIPVFIFD